MASFTERYHEATKYHPYSIDRLGPVDWDSQPPPFRSLGNGSVYCFAEHLPFLKKFLEGRGLESPLPAGTGQFATQHFLSQLVYFSAGITGVSRNGNETLHYRANPSAGALYPIELYFAARGFQGIPDGLYYFHPLLCGAVAVSSGLEWNAFATLFADSDPLQDCHLVFLLTGIFERSAWRYKERSYRRMLLDAGCLLGNLQIQAQAQGVPSRILGAFKDRELEALLELGPGEVPLMGLAVDPVLKNWNAFPFRNAGPEPQQAVQRLQAYGTSSLYQQQNLVERIENSFRAASCAHSEPINGPRIALLPSPYGQEALARHLPRLGLLRRSCRRFRAEPVAPDALGAILQMAYQPYHQQHLSAPFLKSWLIVHDVEGLAAGVYHYLPEEHSLVAVHIGSLREEMRSIALGQELAEDCSAILVHTANLSEATACCGDRIYRYLKADAGALGEAVNLYAGLYLLGSSGLAAYFDDEVNRILALPVQDAILYMTTLGVSADTL